MDELQYELNNNKFNNPAGYDCDYVVYLDDYKNGKYDLIVDDVHGIIMGRNSVNGADEFIQEVESVTNTVNDPVRQEEWKRIAGNNPILSICVDPDSWAYKVIKGLYSFKEESSFTDSRMGNDINWTEVDRT